MSRGFLYSNKYRKLPIVTLKVDCLKIKSEKRIPRRTAELRLVMFSSNVWSIRAATSSTDILRGIERRPPGTCLMDNHYTKVHPTRPKMAFLNITLSFFYKLFWETISLFLRWTYSTLFKILTTDKKVQTTKIIRQSMTCSSSTSHAWQIFIGIEVGLPYSSVNICDIRGIFSLRVISLNFKNRSNQV